MTVLVPHRRILKPQLSIPRLNFRRLGDPSFNRLGIQGQPWGLGRRTKPPVSSETIDDQVEANADDVYGLMAGAPNDASSMYAGANAGGEYRSIYRFVTNISGLAGSTITVAYVEVYIKNSPHADTLTKIYANDAEAPTMPVDAAEWNGMSKTSAAVDWDGALSNGQFNQSPSIVSVIQELADSHDPSAILIMHEDDGSANLADHLYQMETHNASGPNAAKLHIEYTPA